MFSVHDTTVGPFAAVTLRDDAAGSHATIVPARGAIATSFFANGSERLYLDEATLLDPKLNVRGGIPVLFPSPGKLLGDAFSRDGVSGSMKQHGFARNAAFTEIGRATDDAAMLELGLAASDATRAQFPFELTLRLRFALAGATLAIRAEVRNGGAVPLPFALGYHPYFAVPTGEKESARIPTGATRAWDNVAKGEIALAGIALGAGEVDLHLLDHGARTATLETAKGTIELRGDFDRWVVWTLPGKDFVCLEPWSAPADALNSGEGLTTLAPGDARAFDLAIAAR
jgi:galactose mutarotase-like enzyme